MVAYKAVQVRKRISVQKDGVEIASNFERYTLQAGKIDTSDNFVDNSLDKEKMELLQYQMK